MDEKEYGEYDTFDEWLDATRRAISEEIKDMTPEERVARSIARAEPIMKEFNLKWATLRPVKPMRRERLPA